METEILNFNGLSTSLINCEKDSAAHQKKISFLQNELLHYEQLQAGHLEDKEDLRQRQYDHDMERGENFCDDLKSRYNGFLLSAGLLKEHHKKLKAKAANLVKIKENLAARRAANEKKISRMENKFMKINMKKKIVCLYEDVHAEVTVGETEVEECGRKIRELMTLIDDTKESYKNENKRIYEESTHLLEQEAQIDDHLNRLLKEQETEKCDVTKELSSINTELKTVNDEFEKKECIFNESKKSSVEKFNELEQLDCQINEDLETISESLISSEELSLKLQEDMDSLIQTQSDLSFENQNLNGIIPDLETNARGSDEKASVLEESLTENLKTEETLDQQIEEMLEKNCIAQNMLHNLKEDSQLEEIQQRTVIHDKEFSEIEQLLNNEEERLLDLESDLRLGNELCDELLQAKSANLSLKSEIHDLKVKRDSFMKEDDDLRRNIERSNEKSQGLRDELIAAHEASNAEIERITKDYENVEEALELTEDQISEYYNKDNDIEISLSNAQLQKREVQSVSRDKSELKLKLDEEMKDTEKDIELRKTDHKDIKEKVGNMCKDLIKKTKDKSAAWRNNRVQFENLSEKHIKFQKVDVKLQELLTKSLKENSLACAKSKKVSFSEKLEKHSPSQFVASDLQTTKPILKRRPVYSAESLKRIKKEVNPANDPYFPKFE